MESPDRQLMFDLNETLRRISEQTILCVGDLMLDDFIYGDISRISPEAPAPVIAVRRQERVIGGAGNVARNVADMGARCTFIGVIGDDEAGRLVASSLALFQRINSHLIVDRSRPTTRKVRFVSDHHSTHLLRADWEEARLVGADIEAAVIERALAELADADAVVLSDYAKGVLTPGVVRAVVETANKCGQPVVVDPKGVDFTVYRGATVITPNRKELADATHRPAATIRDVAVAAAELCEIVQSRAVLVTLSEEGMLLHVAGSEPVHVLAYPVKIRDVSGAGDTVAGVLATMLAMDVALEPAVRAANAAASVAVGKRGTSSVSVAEIRARMLPPAATAEDKIVYDWQVLDDRLYEWRTRDLRIGFTNGCFDLLHPGHVRVLAEARAACDRLIVGLNSDASVNRLKGDGRPIQDEHARAEILAALGAVDLVVIFDHNTPLELIQRVRPNVLVKGGDYSREQVVGREIVEALGGKVIVVSLLPGHSTTALACHRTQGKIGLTMERKI